MARMHRSSRLEQRTTSEGRIIDLIEATALSMQVPASCYCSSHLPQQDGDVGTQATCRACGSCSHW